VSALLFRLKRKNRFLIFVIISTIFEGMQAKPSQPPPKPKDEPKSRGNIIDAFVKRMFSRMVVFVDFLLFYADRDFVNAIDLAKIEPAPTHYIGKDADERIVDLVFQCPLKNGKGGLMAVIVFEHQSGSLKKIPLKLLKYIGSVCLKQMYADQVCIDALITMFPRMKGKTESCHSRTPIYRD